MLKLFLISQDINTGYDTYDSAVVCAKSKKAARKIHPNIYGDNKEWWLPSKNSGDWCDNLEQVQVEYLGIADESQEVGIICTSFNAG